jgi:hypothetical protein
VTTSVITASDRGVHESPARLERPSRAGLQAVVAQLVCAAALTFAAAAAAEPPAGFVEQSRLEPIASSLAGRPVQLFCARDLLAWGAFAWQSVGGDAALVDEDGLVEPAADVMYLPSDTCGSLIDRLNGRRPPLRMMATAILALVHESEHLAGIGNESTADCTALTLVPIVAITAFHYASSPKAKHHQLHNLVALAWDRHRQRPDQYQTLC